MSHGWTGAMTLLILVPVSAGRAVANDEAVIALWGDAAWNAAACARSRAADCQAASSLAEAQSLIERYRIAAARGSGTPLKTLRVVVAPGVHRLTQPLEIDHWGDARGGPTLIIEGAGEDRTIIAGSVAVPMSAWRPLARATLLDPSAATKVRVVNYETLTGRRATRKAAGELFGQELQPVAASLVFDDRPMTLARWPNAGYAAVRDAVPTDHGGILVRFSGSAGPHELPATGAFISGYPFEDWAYERIPVSRDETDGHAAHIAKGATSMGVRAGQRVIVENSLAELDSPGEWFLEESTQELYFWPPAVGAAQGAGLELAVADLLVRIKDSADVRIEALTLQNSLGEAIDIDAGSRIEIDHVAIRNTANRAISIIGGEHVSVRDCLLQDLGAGGIYLYGGDRASLRPGGHRVEHCEIRRFGERIKSYQPAIRLEGVGNAAVSNYLHDAPHAAIIFSGNDQWLEANHIAQVVLESDDAGAIYTGRDWTARGSVIRNNFVSHVHGKTGAHQAVGLYLDDQASGNTVEENVFVDVNVGILLGGGRDNVIRHNIFVANRSGIALDARGVTWQSAQTQDRNGTLWKNLTRIPVDSPAYRQKYPHLAELRSDDLGLPKYDELRWNLFVASGGIDARDAGYFSWKESENVHVGWDVFKNTGTARRDSPQGYEIDARQLPPSWPTGYASRKMIPN